MNLCEMTSLDLSSLLYNEWLVTNGLGGFAASSICCAPMRQYHALLIAALPAPYGRTVMLNYVDDVLVLPDRKEVPLSVLRTAQSSDIVAPPLTRFKLEGGIPVWRYEVGDVVLEKSLLMIHEQNTVHVRYRLLSSHEGVEIRWRPFFHFRTHDQMVNMRMESESYAVHTQDGLLEIRCPSYPPLRLYNAHKPPFTLNSQVVENVFYEIEARRGYESIGRLTSPGYYFIGLQTNQPTAFVASTESWIDIHALTSDEARAAERLRQKRILRAATATTTSHTPVTRTLMRAADQFIITPKTRHKDILRLQAAGEEARSIIAGYPWFTDWGRDTMISLEGLTLSTGRPQVAHAILITFAHYIKDGLIPNMFPEGEVQGLYHTADATLWLFHALDRYIETTGDTDILDIFLPKLRDIVDFHIRGTHFGIKVAPDGLLVQGQEGYQLTWMDAKVGDWVVTPRRGKAVEINALWYNALRLFERWSGKTLDVTARCYDSFNQRFWYASGGYLYDVVDGEQGDDSALRPNQLFAISLAHPVLIESRWQPVLESVKRDLLTPLGLRTLTPSHPDYKPMYDGDLRSRDAAYHQGTVWPWLLGPFIDVWLKVYPDEIDEGFGFLKALEAHFYSHCAGSISEIFDSQKPYHARGCFAQAWSVAEFLRALLKLTNRQKR